MAYIRLSDNAYPLSERDIRNAFPNTSFATPFNPDGYAVVFPVPQPAFDQYSQKCAEQAPQISTKGTWEQVWLVTDLTGEELEEAQARKVADEAAKRATMTLTMRQCRLQLNADAVYETVNAAVATMPMPAQIEWEYATEVQRSNSLVPAMQTILGWDDTRVDQFYTEGALL